MALGAVLLAQFASHPRLVEVRADGPLVPVWPGRAAGKWSLIDRVDLSTSAVVGGVAHLEASAAEVPSLGILRGKDGQPGQGGGAWWENMGFSSSSFRAEEDIDGIDA